MIEQDLSKNQPLHNLNTKETPLLLACSMGLHDIADLVLKHFPKLVISKLIPLHVACSRGDSKMVALLLDTMKRFICLSECNKVNLDTRDEKGYTPLHNACNSGSVDVTRLLTDFWQQNSSRVALDINAPAKYSLRTPLHVVVQKGSSDIVEHLLTVQSIDVNVLGHPSDVTQSKVIENRCKNTHGCVIPEAVESGSLHEEGNEKPQPEAQSKEAQADTIENIAHTPPRLHDDSGPLHSNGRPLFYTAPTKRVIKPSIAAAVASIDSDGEYRAHSRSDRQSNLKIYEHEAGKLNFNSEGKIFDELVMTPLAEACAFANKAIMRLLLLNGACDINGLACRIAHFIHLPDLMELILSYHTEFNDPEVTVLKWHGMKLPLCMGEWVGLETEFYPSRGTLKGGPEVRKVGIKAISVVRLDNNQLLHVPIELFQLQNVREINISGNKIAELPTLKSSGWACPNLEILNVSSNQLTCIPTCIWGLQHLCKLVYSNNRLESILPSEELLLEENVSGSLQLVDVSSNQLKGMVLSFLFTLPSVGSLDLSSNLIDELPDNFWGCSSLQSLNLSNNQLSALPMCAMEQISSVSALNLSKNNFSIFPPSLACFAPKLTSLDVSKNPLTEVDSHFLHSMAAQCENEEMMILTLIEDFSADVSSSDEQGKTLLHSACSGKNVNLVRKLVLDCKADPNVEDNQGNTPLHVSVQHDQESVAFALVNDLKVKRYLNRSLLHIACSMGKLSFVESLINEHNEDVLSRDDDHNTPLHVAAMCGHEDMVSALIHRFKCDITVKGYLGRSLLHSACSGGNISLVKTLHRELKVDVNARDDQNNTPLHVAALCGKKDVVLALINELKCDPSLSGDQGRSLLHSACAGGHDAVVKCFCAYISPLVVDSNGDTPLHICAALDHSKCVEVLLSKGAPILMGNKSGKLPLNVAVGEAKVLINDFIKKNQGKICDYDAIKKIARTKYSSAEHVTRIFVIGNTGAGKSSLIETLKREGFMDRFRTVSESSVPPHTAGIVPSIHMSNYYGRVLFYDFAGDPEYYSSHAAILENLASSSKGDNIFIIVVNLEEGNVENILEYWSTFIQNQEFFKKECFIVVGSHLDSLPASKRNEKVREFQAVCEAEHHNVIYFMLNCCKPKSKAVSDIQKHILSLIENSPKYELSLHASVLLGLLEKEFGHVVSCSFRDLLSLIENAGIDLPKDVPSFHMVLHELHDIGLLFMITGNDRVNSQIVLKFLELTNNVHQKLFSKDLELSNKLGIIPHNVLERILPDHITKECLIQLQYCQEIKHESIDSFPALSDSSEEEFFLYFPALCTANRGAVLWNSSDVSYSIGWLARCAPDSHKCFPPRFLHVLLLRLVFKFTLLASRSTASPNHLQRKCTMWTSGVHWLMNEGVECMVEVVNASKGVVVLVKGCNEAENTYIPVFTDVINTVSVAIDEFCPSVEHSTYFLDSTNEADYFSEDHMFAVSDLDDSSGSETVIVSVSGKGHSSKILSIYKQIKVQEGMQIWQERIQDEWVVERSEVHITEELLGKGGWGEVKVAEFRGTRVAAKSLYQAISFQYYEQLFIREIHMAARIRHPNLVQFIGACMEDGLVLLTELLPTSLRKELEREDCHMSPDQLKSISLDVARALNYLHQMQPDPIIHRDISSANVLLEPLVDQRWRAKVTDYGSVNLQRQLNSENPGSPVYAAPEACNPALQSPKMDIFSFGVLLVEMCTARFPEVSAREDLIASIQSREWVGLIRRCTQQDRDSRPSAAEIIAELQQSMQE